MRLHRGEARGGSGRRSSGSVGRGRRSIGVGSWGSGVVVGRSFDLQVRRFSGRGGGGVDRWRNRLVDRRRRLGLSAKRVFNKSGNRESRLELGGRNTRQSWIWLRSGGGGRHSFGRRSIPGRRRIGRGFGKDRWGLGKQLGDRGWLRRRRSGLRGRSRGKLWRRASRWSFANGDRIRFSVGPLESRLSRRWLSLGMDHSGRGWRSLTFRGVNGAWRGMPQVHPGASHSPTWRGMPQSPRHVGE